MLPCALTSRLDLDRLRALPGSFVDATLRWRHSDLLFTAPMECRDAFVFDLDRGTAEAARQYLPRFRFLLDDLARVDEQILRARPLTPQARMTLLLLKIAAGNPRIADELRKWVDDLREILQDSDGIEDFVALLTYIESVGEAPTGELQDLFAQLGPEAEEAYVTTAEMLRSEGAAAAKAESVLTVLEARAITVPESARARITRCTDLDQLETWVRKAVTVTSTEELFA